MGGVGVEAVTDTGSSVVSRADGEITELDIALAGTGNITVFNYEPGGGTSNAKVLTVTP